MLSVVPEESSSYKNLNKVVNLADRCKKIIKGLLDFSRRHEYEIESVNVDDIIVEIFSVVEITLDKSLALIITIFFFLFSG